MECAPPRSAEVEAERSLLVTLAGGLGWGGDVRVQAAGLPGALCAAAQSCLLDAVTGQGPRVFFVCQQNQHWHVGRCCTASVWCAQVSQSACVMWMTRISRHHQARLVSWWQAGFGCPHSSHVRKAAGHISAQCTKQFCSGFAHTQVVEQRQWQLSCSANSQAVRFCVWEVSACQC